MDNYQQLTVMKHTHIWTTTNKQQLVIKLTQNHQTPVNVVGFFKRLPRALRSFRHLAARQVYKVDLPMRGTCALSSAGGDVAADAHAK